MRTPQISLALLIAATLALGACGQKGPLYLPQDPAAPAATGAAGPATQPAVQPQDKDQKQSPEQQTEQHTEAEAVSK